MSLSFKIGKSTKHFGKFIFFLVPKVKLFNALAKTPPDSNFSTCKDKPPSATPDEKLVCRANGGKVGELPWPHHTNLERSEAIRMAHSVRHR